MKCFVGIDLGGTNIKVGVVDDLGRPLKILVGNAQTGIMDFKHQPHGFIAHLQLHKTGGGEFHGIVQQVDQDLFNHFSIAQQLDRLTRKLNR